MKADADRDAATEHLAQVAHQLDRGEIEAPAKLTLTLVVEGVRSDGYHLLRSEMISVNLSDTLRFEAGDELTVVDEVVGDRGIKSISSGPDNLVNRALRLTEKSASVELVKRIPAGAGLGGGSADAAAILWWAGFEDLDAASKIGADVPFCIRGGRAIVSGIGEVLEPQPFEDRQFVLLVPPVEISTAQVYRAWDLGFKTSGRSETPNELEAAAYEVAPGLKPWRDLLCEVTGERPRLAGSGSTLFIEGDPLSLGIEHLEHLEAGGESARLVTVRTVPARDPR